MTKHNTRCLLKERDSDLKPDKRVVDFILNYSKSISYIDNKSFEKIKVDKN